MICLKCGQTEMYSEYDWRADTEVLACFKCGFRKYSKFPIQKEIVKTVRWKINAEIERGE